MGGVRGMGSLSLLYQLSFERYGRYRERARERVAGVVQGAMHEVHSHDGGVDSTLVTLLSPSASGMYPFLQA